MPDDIVVYMTEDDLIDLVEYLLTLKTPSLTPDSWHIAGPFDNGPDDAGLDEGLSAGEGHRPEGDLRRQGRQGGVADGQGRTPAATSICRRSTAPHSANNRVVPVPRDRVAGRSGRDRSCSAPTTAASCGSTTSWSTQTDATRAAAPEQDAVKVKLKKGTNTHPA